MAKFVLKETGIDAAQYSGTKESFDELAKLAEHRTDCSQAVFIDPETVLLPERANSSLRMKLGHWYVRDADGANFILTPEEFERLYQAVEKTPA